MKTIMVTFKKTRHYNLPVAIPDHWAHNDVRNALEERMGCHTDLTDLLAGLDWETGATTEPNWVYVAEGFVLHVPLKFSPIYSFPDEPSLSHPDQLDLLGAA